MNIKALIVGDDQTGNNLLKAILEFEGIQAVEAENGLEALEILAKADIGLVISDAHMPAMDGFEMISTIRLSKRHANIKIILYTATCVSVHNEAEAYRIGVDRYVRKSGSTHNITTAINQLVNENEGLLTP